MGIHFHSLKGMFPPVGGRIPPDPPLHVPKEGSHDVPFGQVIVWHADPVIGISFTPNSDDPLSHDPGFGGSAHRITLGEHCCVTVEFIESIHAVDTLSTLSGVG